MKESRKKIKAFDKQLLAINEDVAFPCRIGSFVLFFAAAVMLDSPIQFGLFDMKIYFLIIVIMVTGIWLYLKPYMVVNEDGKIISLYKKIVSLPVSRHDFFRIRLCYLNRVTIILLVATMVLQTLTAVTTKRPFYYNLSYTLVTLLLTWLAGLGYIRPQ